MTVFSRDAILPPVLPQSEQQTTSITLLVTFLFIQTVGATAYSCPEYSTIRQPSVDPPIRGGKFKIQEISGEWYLQARLRELRRSDPGFSALP